MNKITFKQALDIILKDARAVEADITGDGNNVVYPKHNPQSNALIIIVEHQGLQWEVDFYEDSNEFCEVRDDIIIMKDGDGGTFEIRPLFEKTLMELVRS